MKDTAGYVPSQAVVAQETEQIPLIPEVRLRPDPPGSLTKKRLWYPQEESHLTTNDRRQRSSG